MINSISNNSVQFLRGEKCMFLFTFFEQIHFNIAPSVQFTFAHTWGWKWASASTPIKMKFLILTFGDTFWKRRFWRRLRIFADTLTRGPPLLTVPRGDTTSRGGPAEVNRTPVLLTRTVTAGDWPEFWQSHRSPMPLSNFRNRRRRPLVLLAGLRGRRPGPCCWGPCCEANPPKKSTTFSLKWMISERWILPLPHLEQYFWPKNHQK